MRMFRITMNAEYRVSGGSEPGDDYLVVTELPWPEIHWQVPDEEFLSVRELLDSTNWDEPQQFQAMVLKLGKYELR